MGLHDATLHLVLIFFIISTVQGCRNATAEEQEQTLTIPMNATGNRSDHCWWISVDPRLPNHRIEIKIPRSFKCGLGDLLEIHNDNTESHMTCNAAQRFPVIRAQQSVFVRFKSANEGGNRPFFLTVQAVPQQAKKSVLCETAKRTAWWSQQSHYLQSPGYPSKYHRNLNLCWILEAQGGEKIVLETIDFSLEYSPSCTKDFVEIRDGGDASAAVIAKWCQRSSTKTLRSTGNLLFVRFRTDNSGERMGFKFRFFQQKTDADPVTPSITMAAIAFGTMVICAIVIYRRCMCHKHRRRQQHAMSNINVHMSPVQNVTISNSNGTSVYATPMPSPPPYSAVGASNPAVVDQDEPPPSYESIDDNANRPSSAGQGDR